MYGDEENKSEMLLKNKGLKHVLSGVSSPATDWNLEKHPEAFLWWNKSISQVSNSFSFYLSMFDTRGKEVAVTARWVNVVVMQKHMCLHKLTEHGHRTLPVDKHWRHCSTTPLK